MKAFYEARAEIEGHDPFGPLTRKLRASEVNRVQRPSAKVDPEVMEQALRLRAEGLNAPQITIVMRVYHDVTLAPSTWQKVMREAGAPRLKASPGQFGMS